jgi:hypothetical protein
MTVETKSIDWLGVGEFDEARALRKCDGCGNRYIRTAHAVKTGQKQCDACARVMNDKWLRKVIEAPNRLACYTQRQWDLWSAANFAGTKPCADCTKERQAEMIEQGRCEHPEVMFVIRDGAAYGILARMK